ncbi:hypothetical protein GCM10020001_113180 [Nonomuraea salmonea]
MEDLEELAELLLGAYALTDKLLGLLPIPIRLPSIHTQESGRLLGGLRLWNGRASRCSTFRWSRSLRPCCRISSSNGSSPVICARWRSPSPPDAHRLHGLRAALAKFSELSMEAERQLSPGA